ncbi:MAG: type IV pilin protein [Cellvibrionaceae bacterium]
MVRYKGFTLIELMIVVATVAILAAVAIPNYQTFVIKGKRAEGKAFALDIVARQERHFTQNSRFAGALTGTGAAALDMPSSTSENGYYTGSITLANENTTFVISVDPTFTDTDCETLTVSNTGERDIDGGSLSSDECWR